MGKTRAGCISKVEVLEHGVYVLKTTQAEVEDSIRDNNAARFRLTEDTPTMQEPLKSALGYHGCTEEVKQILAGTYVCPTEVEAFSRSFLDTLTASHP